MHQFPANVKYKGGVRADKTPQQTEKCTKKAQGQIIFEDEPMENVIKKMTASLGRLEVLSF